MRKKLTLLFLCFAMMATLLAVFAASAAADGSDEGMEGIVISTAEELIDFANAVNNGSTYVDKTVVLVADIDLTGYAWAGIGVYKDAAKSFQGTFDGQGYTISGVTFADASNGDASSEANNYRGFFNQIDNATVKNLTVSGNAWATAPASTEYGGALIIGCANNSTVESCIAIGSVNGTHNVAGVVVRVKDSNIINCTNKANITGSYSKMGGVAALVQSSETAVVFDGCVNEGTITSTARGEDGVGGIVGWIGYPNTANITVRNCANKGEISAADTATVGQIAAESWNGNHVFEDNKALNNGVPATGHSAMTGLNYAIVDNDGMLTYVKTLEAGKTYLVTAPNPKPVITLSAGESITFDGTIDASGITVTGEGVTLVTSENENLVTYTAKAPWDGETIKTVEDLLAFAEAVNGGDSFEGKTVTLMNDIDLTGYAWAGVGIYSETSVGTAFSGTFDGQGHKISGVTFANNASGNKYRGFFNQLYKATVKNVTIVTNGFGYTADQIGTMPSSMGGAVIAGHAIASTIENCVAEGTFVGTHNVAGIVVLIQGSTIKDCTNKANLTGNYTKLGGIVNFSQHKGVDANYKGSLIENCVNEGTITSTANGKNGVGGIIGWIGYGDGAASSDAAYAVTIKNCENKGAVTATATTKVGQIVGSGESYIVDGGNNKGLTTTFGIGDNNGYFAYATVENGIATYVSTLEAGKTYLVTAPSAKAVIALAEGESITFDTNLATIDASGITVVGAELKTTTNGNETTYTAWVAPTYNLGAAYLSWKDDANKDLQIWGEIICSEAINTLVINFYDNEGNRVASTTLLQPVGDTVSWHLRVAGAEDPDWWSYEWVGGKPSPDKAPVTAEFIVNGENAGTLDVKYAHEVYPCESNWADYFVASVNGEYYFTLQSAIDAAGSGETVTLLADIYLETTVTIAADKNVTLDLAGFAITAPQDIRYSDINGGGTDFKDCVQSIYAFDNKGTLTLQDSVGTGSITARGIKNYGTMVMNGGTIYTCGTNGGYGVWNYGHFTMNGGAIKTTHHVGEEKWTWSPTCLNNTSGATAIITGGTLESTNVAVYVIISEGTLEITPAEGKTVTVKGPRGVAIDAGTAVINGGSFTTTPTNEWKGWFALYVEENTGATVTINDGYFNADGIFSVSLGNDNNATVTSTITINGGTFDKPAMALGVNKEDALTILGGKFLNWNPACASADSLGWGAFDGIEYHIHGYVAEGKIGVQDADGYYTLTDGTFVAKTNTRCYASIQDAINAAKTGETITLIENIELVGETIKVANGQTVVLDLNGKTITAIDNKTSGNYDAIYNEGNLTIKDSVGGGKITLTATTDRKYASYSAVISNHLGTLTVDGGTIEHLGGTSMAYAIDNRSNTGSADAVLTINGGIVKSGYIAIRQFANSTTGSTILIVNGGEIYGGNTGVWIQSPNAGANVADLTVTGGTIGGGSRGVLVYSTSKTTVALEGGEISGFNVSVSEGTVEDAKITKGDSVELEAPAGYNWVEGKLVAKVYVAQSGDVKYESLQDAVNAGGKVTLLKDIALAETVTIAADKNVTLDLAGFVISGADNATGSFELIANKGTLTIEDSVGGGKITLTATNDRNWNAYSAVIANLGGTLTINGGTIEHLGGTDMAYAIDNNSTIGDTILIVNGGEILSNNYRAVRMFANSTTHTNSVTVNGGTVKGGSSTLGNNAWSTAIWMQNPGANANKASLTVGAAAQIGSVNVYAASGADASGMNLSIAGEALIQDDPKGVASVLDNVADESYVIENVNGTYGIVKVNYVAEITAPDGTVTKYVSLQDAINAGGEITLLTDVVLTEGLTVAAGQTVVLDLAGYTVSYTSDEAKATAAINNKGILTIKDTVGGGKITYNSTAPSTSYASNTILNGGTFTLEGGTIENTTAKGASYAIDTAWYNTIAPVIHINGGKVIAAVDAIRLIGYADESANTLIITGGEVIGKRAVLIQLPGSDKTVAPKVSLEITGGTLTSTDTAGNYRAIYSYSYGNAYSGVSVNISNGIFNGDITLGAGYSHYAGEGAETVNITGGSFYGKYGCIYTYTYDEDDKTGVENISISGGKFDDYLIEEFCADGYIPASYEENGVTYYGVKKGAYVAEANGTKYESLQDAINAGGEITLLTDVVLTEGLTVAVGNTVTLNLAGYTVSYTSDEAKATAAITNNGTLTIKGEGTITYKSNAPSAAYAYATNTITNCGTLTITDVTVINQTAGGAAYAIDNNSSARDAIASITNCTIESGEDGIRQFANSASNKNTVTINGGSVTGASTAIWVQLPSKSNTAYNAELNITGDVVLTGGTAKYGDVYLSTSGNSYEAVKVAITGGTFTNGIVIGAGKNNTFPEVTKGESVELAAPTGYKWNDEGKLVFVTVIANSSYSVNFNEILHINKYVTISGSHTQQYIEENGGMLVWSTKPETVEFDAQYAIAGLKYHNGTYTQQTHGIAPKNISDTIYVCIYLKLEDGSYVYGSVSEYSIKAYCDYIISNSESYSETAVNMAKATLAYNIAAQIYFEYNAEGLVQPDTAETWSKELITAVDKANVTGLTGAADALSGIGLSKSVSFENELKVNYYVNLRNQFSWTVDAEKSYMQVWFGTDAAITDENVSYTVAIKEFDGKWTAQTNGIKSHEYEKAIYIRFVFVDTAGDIHYTPVASYSIEQYCMDIIELNTSTENAIALAKNTVIYGEACKKYVVESSK